MMCMYKQAIIVRKDLKWKKGKLAAHVAHASLGAVMVSPKDVVESWNSEGAKKVVLKIENEKELKRLEKLAEKKKLPHFLARDAGRTQLKASTTTALAIGPAREKEIDAVAGKLKLL